MNTNLLYYRTEGDFIFLHKKGIYDELFKVDKNKFFDLVVSNGENESVRDYYDSVDYNGHGQDVSKYNNLEEFIDYAEDSYIVYLLNKYRDEPND